MKEDDDRAGRRVTDSLSCRGEAGDSEDGSEGDGEGDSEEDGEDGSEGDGEEDGKGIAKGR